MFQKILCAVDFSPPSDAALQLAARIAANTGAELVIAYAWHLAPVIYGDGYTIPVDTISLLKKEDHRSLDASAAEARKLGATRVSARWLDGVPWDQIVSTAKHDHFDLIVIGSHGRTGLTRFVLGSVAEKIIRHASCSVIVARGTAAPPFHRVLCPVDFSDSSRAAMRRAADLVAPDGSLTLTHALQIPWATRATPAPELLADADKHATHQLEQWSAELGAKVKVKLLTTTATTGPATQVLTTVEDEPTFDLIAVGSHGRTGIRRVLLGSVAERIVRHAPCSVLVERTGDDD